MFKNIGFAVMSAALSAAAIVPASAQDSASCDYFRNSLIGTKCAQTIGVGVGASFDDLRIKYTYVGGHAEGQFTNRSITGHLSFTPLHWLTISGSSSYDWTSFKSTDWDDRFGVFTDSRKEQAVGFQTLNASANVFDSGAGISRYVLNVHGQVGWLPSSDRYKGGHGLDGGVTGAAQWRVSPSYSFNAKAGVTAHKFSESSTSLLVSHARLLWSHDLAGIAFGPRFVSHYRDSSEDRARDAANGVHRSQFSNEIGAILIATPFKASESQLLAGLVLQVHYDHSLGQAAWLWDRSTATSDSIGGSAMFHFKY